MKRRKVDKTQFFDESSGMFFGNDLINIDRNNIRPQRSSRWINIKRKTIIEKEKLLMRKVLNKQFIKKQPFTFLFKINNK